MKTSKPLHIFLILLLAVVLVCNTVIDKTAMAATNSVQGGVGGINNGTMIGGDGTGDAQVVVDSLQLSLNKQARNLAGAVINNGDDVTSGQEVYFVIYVDNPTAYPAVDVQITDALNETEFTYVGGSIEYISVVTGTDLGTVWAAGWTALSDDVNGPDDLASCIDTGGDADRDNLTIGQVTGQANLQLDIAGNTLWALRIRVTIK